MKILYLTTGCFDKGGISRYSRYQIQALRDLFGDDSIRVYSLLGPDEDSFEEPLDVFWHGENGTGTDKARFATQALIGCALWRPDVIHTAHVHFAPLVHYLKKFCRAKTCLNVYGLEIWSGLSVCRRNGLSAMNCVIADCHHTADYVHKERMHGRRPEVIWDCADLTRFAPGICSNRIRDKYGIRDKSDCFVILTLGRLSKGAMHKGYDRLIDVFARHVETHPDSQLVIAGHGDKSGDLKNLCIQKGISNAVCFTGSVDEQDLADVYRSASVFSLVSDRGVGRGEGIPLTPLEAMSCGIPIIVGNQDGSQEAVIKDRNGFVIDPFDLETHGQHICKLHASKQFQTRLGEQARLVAETYFGYERFRKQHEELYESFKCK